MEKSSETLEKYFSVIDNFGSEVGSTLDDLATGWETTNKNEINGVDKEMDDIGTRLAKPLFFANPVYDLVHKNLVQPTIKRPTLIPLAQLNGGNVSKEDGKYQKAKPVHKQKNPHHSHGILSKISSSVGRRTSRHKTNADSESLQSEHSISSPQITPRSSIDETFMSSNKTKDVSPQNQSEVNINNAEHQELSSPVSTERDSILISGSPQKISDVVSNVNTTVTDISNANKTLQTEVISSHPIPHPRLKSQSSPVKNVELNDSSSGNLSLSPKNLQVVASPESTASFGSVQSLESVPSDDASDTTFKTMADVMTEVSMEDTDLNSSVKQKAEEKENTHNVREFVETPGRLRRNKTLRWTGTRNAPALIREFTRKNKQRRLVQSTEPVGTDNVEESSHDCETKDISGNLQSNVPLQQATDSEKKEDTSDETCNEADMSSSDNSADMPIVLNEKRTRNQNKGSLPEASKEPCNRDSAFIVLSSLLPPAPKLRRTQSSKVRAYLQKLGNNVNNALGYAVTQFVEQTLKNQEKRPLVLLHDIRSFLTDIKRYLITNPHIGLVKKIQRMVNKTSMTDIEGAIDDSLDRLVLYPLHDMIYRCLVLDYTKSKQLTLLQEAIRLAKKKTPKELGIRDTLIPPNHESMEVIKSHFTQLQRTYSPYFKLKELLAAVMKIYQNTKDLNTEDLSASKIGADDFLPLLVYAIVQCDFVAADIETQYIDGLLDPSLLLGEGGYYLTTLISAIQVVFSMKRKESALPNIADLQGFLKVGISPSEASSHNAVSSVSDEVVFHKTLHVPPAMTSRNLCQMIAKKFHVAVPDNYCLHVVVNGVPHPLEPNECPQLVKMDLLTQFSASAFYFSFQRREDVESNQIATSSDPAIQQTDDMLVAVTGEEETEQPVFKPVEEDHCDVMQQEEVSDEAKPMEANNPTLISDEPQQVDEYEDPLLAFAKENEKPLDTEKDNVETFADESTSQLLFPANNNKTKHRAISVPEIRLTSTDRIDNSFHNPDAVDDFYLDRSPTHRMSCMVTPNSVASLTEFFESQTSPGHSPTHIHEKQTDVVE